MPLPLQPVILLPLSRSASLFHLEMRAERLDYNQVDVRVFERYGTTTYYVERMPK